MISMLVVSIFDEEKCCRVENGDDDPLSATVPQYSLRCNAYTCTRD
jgi:hypothetical protein